MRGPKGLVYSFGGVFVTTNERTGKDAYAESVCHMAGYVNYLSIFGGQVQGGPVVVVRHLGVSTALQQQGRHLLIAAGTRHMELEH